MRHGDSPAPRRACAATARGLRPENRRDRGHALCSSDHQGTASSPGRRSFVERGPFAVRSVRRHTRRGESAVNITDFFDYLLGRDATATSPCSWSRDQVHAAGPPGARRGADAGQAAISTGCVRGRGARAVSLVDDALQAARRELFTRDEALGLLRRIELDTRGHAGATSVEQIVGGVDAGGGSGDPQPIRARRSAPRHQARALLLTRSSWAPSTRARCRRRGATTPGSVRPASPPAR